MPRDGSGTYTRAVSAYVNGTIASATTVNTEMDDIASALTGSLPVNGSKGMSAALDMGGFKVTNVAAGTNANDAIRYGQISTFSWTLLDDADAAAFRTTLGAQSLDATLTALAALSTSADTLIYATGSDTFATSGLTSVARTLLAQSTQALMRTTGLGFSSDASTFVAAANYAAMRAALGAVNIAGDTMTGELILSSATPTAQRSAGTRSIIPREITLDDTVGAADNGGAIILGASAAANRTLTFPAGLPVGFAVKVFVNNTTRSLILARGSLQNMYREGDAAFTSANFTVGPAGSAVIWQTQANTWFVAPGPNVT